VRPLVLGRLERGWVVASETAALDIVGASFVREVEPGELLAIDEQGLRSRRFAEPARKGCVFEYVYLARPDTSLNGRSVHESRVEMGRQLAQEHPVEADMVMPTPESGTPAAIGYAEASGIPYGAGLVKNAYVGRTFIAPSQTIRQLGIRLKLNPLRDVIRGKRLVVIDDSIVRGNTQRALVRMLREAGAEHGKALIVNTASKCGYTPQYEGLQELYDRYGERGLVVLGFPSNDFGNQEPGAAEEIANFCRLNYGVTFPMMAKVHTKGPAQAPIYQMLTTESAEEFRGEVQWNFTKFLVDGDGRVVARFDSAVEPLDPRITAAVEALLVDEGPEPSSP